MKFRGKALIAACILGKKLRRKKAPIFVSWLLTNKCNYRCKYCDIWNRNEPGELNVQQVKFIIDELSGCGTKAIAFSGGEPLLRCDIKEIIDYCREKNIYTKLTTNGSLVPGKVDAIKNADLIKLSFDGPQEIHDLQRQEGSYKQVMEAAKILQDYNINVAFNCVISKLNIEHLGYVLSEAKRLNIKVTFQPLEYRSNRDFIKLNIPDAGRYKNALKMVIAEKRKRNSVVENSLPVLMYLSNYPDFVNTKCWAGIFHFRMAPDGRIFTCDKLSGSRISASCLEGNLSSILKSLKRSTCIQGCWRNTTIELNHLLSFRLHTLLDAVNFY